MERTKHGLYKPDKEDFYNIEDFNNNTNIMEAHLDDSALHIDLGNIAQMEEPDELTQIDTTDTSNTMWGKIKKSINMLLAHIKSTATDSILGHIKIGTGLQVTQGIASVKITDNFDTESNTSVASSSTVKKLKEYIDIIMNRLANEGIREGVRIIEVGSLKEYTSLVDAVKSIKENEATIIKIYEGSYDVSAAKNTNPSGLMIPNNCYLVGVGEREKIIIYAELPSNDGIFSPINLTKNCGLFNLFITAKRCRYVIHDDFDDFNQNSKRVINNCIFQGYDLALEWTYGAGIKGGATLEFENVVFINNSGRCAFSVHNMTRATEESNIYFKNCEFYTIRPQGYGIRLAAVMNYEGSTLTNKVNVVFEACNNVSIIFDKEYGEGNPFEIFGNTEMCFVAWNGQKYSFNQIHNPYMMYKPFPYDLSIGKGYPVFRNYYNQVAHMIGLGVQFFGGIALGSSGNVNNNILVAKKGYFEPDILGLDVSGKTGYFLVYNSAYGTMELSLNNTNAVGYVTNFNQVYLY